MAASTSLPAFPLEGLQPKEATGVLRLLSQVSFTQKYKKIGLFWLFLDCQNPNADGRGAVVAVFDTGRWSRERVLLGVVFWIF